MIPTRTYNSWLEYINAETDRLFLEEYTATKESFDSFFSAIQKRLESQSQTIPNRNRRNGHILSLVVAHTFNINRFANIQNQLDLNTNPVEKRLLLADAFALLEIVSKSYYSLLEACDGDESMLWHNMRRLQVLPSTIGAFSFKVD